MSPAVYICSFLGSVIQYSIASIIQLMDGTSIISFLLFKLRCMCWGVVPKAKAIAPCFQHLIFDQIEVLPANQPFQTTPSHSPWGTFQGVKYN
jgi:hypothetical protein